MTTILHLDTDSARALARQLAYAAGEMRTQVEGVAGSVSNMVWVSPARSGFEADFEQTRRALLSCMTACEDFGARLLREADEWDAMAALIGDMLGPSAGLAAPERIEFPKWADKAIRVFDVLGNVAPGLAWTLMARAGSTYPGQVILRGAWGRAELAGLSVFGIPSQLTHLSIDNLLQRLPTVSHELTAGAASLMLVKLAADWAKDLTKYGSRGYEYWGTTLAVNAFSTAGTMAISGQAALLVGGALVAVGTAPTVAIAGTVAVGIGVGLAMDHMLTMPVQQIMPMPLAQWITGPVCTEVSLKDIAIEGLTEGVTTIGQAIGTGVANTAGRLDQLLHPTVNVIQSSAAF